MNKLIISLHIKALGNTMTAMKIFYSSLRSSNNKNYYEKEQKDYNKSLLFLNKKELFYMYNIYSEELEKLK